LFLPMIGVTFHEGGQHMNQHTGSRSKEPPLSRVIAIPAGILLACVSAFADWLDRTGTPGFGWVQRFGIIMGAVLTVWGIWGMWTARR
jgi:hypothetical protein